MNVIIQVMCDPNIMPGILFIALSIPLLKGKIPKNQLYGFRIQKAFASDDNWYAINKYGAKQLIVCASLLIVAGIVLQFVRITPPLNVIPLLLATAIPIVKTILFARKLPG